MTRLFISSTQAIELGPEVGKGGEGTVFAVQGAATLCAKVYHHDKLEEETNAKLKRMVANPPTDPAGQHSGHRSIAWPQALLYKDKNLRQLVGFTMPRFDGKKFQKALRMFDPDDRNKAFQGGGFTWQHLLFVARNLSSAVAAIHERDYRIGDLNESNVYVSDEALITILDCDSFQVPDPQGGRTLRCRVGKPEYTAPELQGKQFKDHDRTEATDCFALAVMLFQLMMQGFHPFAARGKLVENAPSTDKKILLGHFAYLPGIKGVAPPRGAPPFALLPPELQDLFLRCFHKGHTKPDLRPRAEEWFLVLKEYKDQRFKNACACKFHRYLDHLGNTCPWCQMVKQGGTDYFPTTWPPAGPMVGQQVAMPAPKSGSKTGSGSQSSTPRSQSTTAQAPPRSSRGSSPGNRPQQPRIPTRRSVPNQSPENKNRWLLVGAIGGASLLVAGILVLMMVSTTKGPTPQQNTAPETVVQPALPAEPVVVNVALETPEPMAGITWTFAIQGKRTDGGSVRFQFRPADGNSNEPWQDVQGHRATFRPLQPGRLILEFVAVAEQPPPSAFFPSPPAHGRRPGTIRPAAPTMTPVRSPIYRREWQVSPNPWGGWTEWTSFQDRPAEPSPGSLVDLSPSGALLLSGGGSNPPRLWRTADGALVTELIPQPALPPAQPLIGAVPAEAAPDISIVHSLAYSPRGTWAATGFKDLVQIWRVIDGRPAPVPVSPVYGPVTCLAFSPDETLLAGCSDQSGLWVWSLKSQQMVVSPKRFGGTVRKLAISADGAWLACASIGGSLQIYRLPEGRLEWTQPGRGDVVQSLAFSPKSNLLACGSQQVIRIYDVDKKDWKEGFNVAEGPAGSVEALVFSPDGRLLAASLGQGKIGFWRTQDGLLVHSFPAQAVTIRGLAWAAPAGLLAVSGADGTVRLWRKEGRGDSVPAVEAARVSPGLLLPGRSATVELAAAPAERPGAFEFRRPPGKDWQPAPAGKMVLDSLAEGLVPLEIRGVRNGTPGPGTEVRLTVEHNPFANWEKVAEFTPESDGAVSCLAFEPMGPGLFAGYADGWVRWWQQGQKGSRWEKKEAHKGLVYGVAVHGEGKTGASCEQDGTLQFWNCDKGSQVRTIKLPLGLVGFTVAYLPDGSFRNITLKQTVVCGTQGGVLVLVSSLAKASTVPSRRVQKGVVVGLAVREGGLDGPEIITAATDGSLLVRTVADEVRQAVTFGNPFRYASIANDWRATASDNATEVRLWQKTRSMALRLPAGTVSSLALRPDGQILAVGTNQGQLYFWRAADGQLLQEMRGFKVPVSCLSYNLENNRLAIGAGNKIQVWGTR